MYPIPEVQKVKIFFLLQNDFGSSGTWNCIKKDARWETHAVMTCSKILCSNYRGLCCIMFFYYFLEHWMQSCLYNKCTMRQKTPDIYYYTVKLKQSVLNVTVWAHRTQCGSWTCTSCKDECFLKTCHWFVFLKHMHEKPYPEFIYCLFQTG